MNSTSISHTNEVSETGSQTTIDEYKLSRRKRDRCPSPACPSAGKHNKALLNYIQSVTLADIRIPRIWTILTRISKYGEISKTSNPITGHAQMEQYKYTSNNFTANQRIFVSTESAFVKIHCLSPKYVRNEKRTKKRTMANRRTPIVALTSRKVLSPTLAQNFSHGPIWIPWILYYIQSGISLIQRTLTIEATKIQATAVVNSAVSNVSIK